MLLKNHTATVEIRTGPMKEFQKNDAKAALVKKLKEMLTGEFKHFNGQASIGDAGVDPAYCQELADFFAEQPGYEQVWGVLRVGYYEHLEKEKREKQQHNIVNMSDAAIREKCQEMASIFKLYCGQAWADAGDTSSLLDQSRHDALIEALMELVKKFAVEKPQYNSYAGLFDMIEDNDFKVEMVRAIDLCYGR